MKNRNLKFIQFILIIIFLYSCNKPQKKETVIEIVKNLSKIDSLNTKLEVQMFIRSIDSDYDQFELKRIQDFDRDFKTDSITKIIANKFKINNSFYKTDFDNNGYTDLLVIGDNKDCMGEKSCSFNSIVLMNYKNDSIKIIDIIKERRYSIVPMIKNENKKTFLIINNPTGINWKNEKYREGSVDKLIYKFGNFIEFNSTKKKYNIEKIEFSTDGCFGTCPIFHLELNQNRSSKFIAEHYNFEKNYNKYSPENEGEFKTIVSKKKYDEITELLNYLNFAQLKNEYFVNWTDDQGCTLKITYDKGKIKTINDYGLIGTYGLKRLYELLYELRFNQDWKKTNTTGNNQYKQ